MFQSGPAKDAKGQPAAPCQMGFWVPSSPDSAGRPGTLTTSGKSFKSSDPQAQCKNIFQAMLDDNVEHVTQSVGSSINLLANPGNPPAKFKLPGGSGTGTSSMMIVTSTYFPAAADRPRRTSRQCRLSKLRSVIRHHLDLSQTNIILYPWQTTMHHLSNRRLRLQRCRQRLSAV